MAQRDIEILRQMYGEWARGDYSREIFAPEVELVVEGLLDMGTVRGRDAAVEAMREWLSQWERPLVIVADEFIEAGDEVVVLMRWHGRGKGSGVEVDGQGAHVWWLRDGKAIRWRVYRDRDEALAAAGLSADESPVEG